MIVVSCNYDMGLMDDLIELFMMGGYTTVSYTHLRAHET